MRYTDEEGNVFEGELVAVRPITFEVERSDRSIYVRKSHCNNKDVYVSTSSGGQNNCCFLDLPATLDLIEVLNNIVTDYRNGVTT
jgi:hypothetical protein